MHRLKAELSDYPDKVFAERLCNGIQFGFHTLISQFPSTTLICENLLSARQQQTLVDELIHKELTKGFLLGPFEKPPFPLFRVSPIGVATGKYSGKKRLIVDLSAPHEHAKHSSINETINKEDCSLSYVKIDDAIRIIQSTGRGSWLCKADISDAFKLLPIRKDQWCLYGIKWREQFYFYQRLTFGCRSSPAIFDQLSQAICSKQL